MKRVNIFNTTRILTFIPLLHEFYRFITESSIHNIPGKIPHVGLSHSFLESVNFRCKPYKLMKNILAIALLLIGSTGFAQLTAPPSGDNQKSVVTQYIGPVSVTVTYNSPDVHAPNGDDRTGKIWGEVAHYGFIDQGFGSSKAAPWRAGANENTIITFSHDVKIDGKELKAGTYGLFLAVEKEGPWTWIFSKNSSSWGSYYYDAKEDALRAQTQAVDAPYTEFLTYGFEDRKSNSTTAYLQWEKKKVPFKIEVPNMTDLYVNIMRNELRTNKGFDYNNIQNAARYCAQNNVNLEEALVWADAAINAPLGREEFATLQTKATVLRALKRDDEADKVMDKAITLPSAVVGAVHQYGRTLLSAGKKEKAMEVFKLNQKLHPEEKFTTYVGLARGFEAMGDKKNAIKNWEIAIKNLPENQKPNLALYEAELKKLKG
jgi:tetratricopeptide (TPR) repeat protein